MKWHLKVYEEKEKSYQFFKKIFISLIINIKIANCFISEKIPKLEKRRNIETSN
jgi:hypothetical protein